MTDKPTGPQTVLQAGQLLYGAEWQSPLARDLGVHLRTIQRIAKAAAEAADYPVAPSVMRKLATLLNERAAKCVSMAAELDGAPQPAVSIGGLATPAPIELTAAALDAGIIALEEMGALRPGKMARATFLAMAQALGLQVVTPALRHGGAREEAAMA